MVLVVEVDAIEVEPLQGGLASCPHVGWVALDLFKLNCVDEDVINRIVCIFKETIFKLNCSDESSLVEKEQFNAVFPLLLQLLDESDGTARAVVTLIAEYCSINSDNHCVKEVVDQLACGNTKQRRNAIDVICELISISKTASGLPHLKWHPPHGRRQLCWRPG